MHGTKTLKESFKRIQVQKKHFVLASSVLPAVISTHWRAGLDTCKAFFAPSLSFCSGGITTRNTMNPLMNDSQTSNASSDQTDVPQTSHCMSQGTFVGKKII